jgi:hypothetical protein
MNRNLKKMDILMKDLLQVSKQDQAIQVDEATLQWTPENMISSVLSKPLVKFTSNDDILDDEDDESRNSDRQNQADGHRNQANGDRNQANSDQNQEINDKVTFKEQYEYEAPTSNITKGAEVTELKKEEEKVNDELGLDLKSPPKQVKASRVVDIAALKQMALEITEQWNIPSFIIAFISNSLDSEEKGRVVPWPHFKKQLFEIYDERISFSAEINGSINSNYLALEEFLILYFLKHNKLRRLAEVKLIEFISSLKYYTKIWPRAKVFAKLTGMLQYSEPIETDANAHSCDIFMQEFFYYAYMTFSDFRETEEGNTYVKLDYVEEELTPKILFWLTENEINKWHHKMRRYVKRMPEDEGKHQSDSHPL